jgi:hypothetical protein
MQIFDLKKPFVVLITMGSSLLLIYMFWGAFIVSTSPVSYDKYKENRELWLTTHPSKYSYEINEGCMFVSTTIAKVINGSHYFQDLENQSFGGNTTIEDLFNIVEKAIFSSHKLSITYNSVYGYPESAEIDWSKDIIDDECFIQMARFKIDEL